MLQVKSPFILSHMWNIDFFFYANPYILHRTKSGIFARNHLIEIRLLRDLSKLDIQLSAFLKILPFRWQPASIPNSLCLRFRFSGLGVWTTCMSTFTLTRSWKISMWFCDYTEISRIYKRFVMKHIISQFPYAIIMALICEKSNKTRTWIVENKRSSTVVNLHLL